MSIAPSPSKPLIERVIRNRPLLSGYWSLVAHLGVGILLALLAFDSRSPATRPRPIVIESRPAAPAADDAEGAAVVQQSAVQSAVQSLTPAEAQAADSPDEPAPSIPAVDLADPPRPPKPDPTASAPTAEPPRSTEANAANQATAAGTPAGGSAGDVPAPAERPQPVDAFVGRRARGRGDRARERGMSAQSEAAVEAGLAWLAAHQAVDGSWRCDLGGCRCDGACRDAGSIASTTASTAIALLPFLGAGSTHEDGPYRETVSRGVYYLASRLQPTPRGGDLCEGTMYGQGLATLALAEAYGMTGDDLVRDLVVECVRFIETSQDQYTGGWRYLPGQPGDITVTAWQVAALKSGELAGLTIPSPAMGGAVRFLDRVQSMQGAAYGYRSPSAKHSTSAIGLLCRMYTGWKPGDEPLDRGIARLAAKPPNPNEVYANFYLSQLLLQAGYEGWPRWNAKLRDGLVRLQSRVGHETGSWFLDDPETAAGGRLAHTALALLTLEVYYRLLPIYGEAAVAGSF